MKQNAVWVCTLLLAGVCISAAQATDLTIRVDAREIARKRVHTDLTLAVKPGPLTLVYPKWLTDAHGPTGVLESMIGLEIKANNERLAWSRDSLDMYALHLTIPPGVERVEISIESGLAMEASGSAAVSTSSAQLAVLAWNEYLLFPKGADLEKVSISASVVVPSGWVLACALSSKVGADGGYEFESGSVGRLIDSPVQMGQYSRAFVLQGSAPRADLKQSISVMADSPGALEVPKGFTQGYDRLVAEAGALFGSRMYRHYTWLLSLSDHIDHFGLEHHESSDDRMEENALNDPDLRMRLGRLLGHEYVHSWNGKYRRPEIQLSPDHQKPMDGSLLWVYEGMTEFWGDVLPTRAGLITPDYIREMLAESAGYFDIEPGARWRPLVDTAVAAQILYFAPDAWRSSRRGVDFYGASVLLWLDVDEELRDRTQGRETLDDFMKRFCAGESGAPQLKPFMEQDIYGTLTSMAPTDWRAFIRRHLDTVGTAALFGALERSGWKLMYSSDPNAAIETDQKRSKTTNRQWSIGLIVDKDSRIVDVIDDRAAARAGAGPGMTVVAVNDRKFSANALDSAIIDAQRTRKPIELLVETGDYFRRLSVEYYDGPRYPHLVRLEGRPDTLSAIFSPRVK